MNIGITGQILIASKGDLVWGSTTCGHPTNEHPAIWYNEYNKVVQCHHCGAIMYGFHETINVR